MTLRPQDDRLVLVTGPSGAGRATAIRVLEDLGFEAIDNIPLRLIPRLLDGGAIDRPIALGIDVRNRDFTPDALLDLFAGLVADKSFKPTLLFLDCSAEILLRRYSETRRRHPLTPDDTPEEGIEQEIALLRRVRDRADIVIDTSVLSPHELKSDLHEWFASDGSQRLAVSLHSFSYKRGMPHGVDMVLDCRFLSNPHWEEGLRALTGLDPAVQSFLQKDPRLAPFAARVNDMLEFLFPEYEAEGKTHFSVGLGCTGGQHRSVAVAEHVGGTLAQHGWRVSIRHRELERKGLAARKTDKGSKAGKAPA